VPVYVGADKPLFSLPCQESLILPADARTENENNADGVEMPTSTCWSDQDALWARSLFDEVLKRLDVPPDLRERIDAFQARLDQMQH
jgi:hypothetical protein